MAEPPPPIVNWVNQHFPRPRVDPQWLKDCYEWLTTSQNLSPTTDFQPLVEAIRDQLLSSDLADSTLPGTGLPTHIGHPESMTVLTGPPVLVQITSITDVGVSAYKLDQTRQVREERIRAGAIQQERGEDGEEVEPDEDVVGEGPMPKYTRSMLKMELSDGTTTIQAIEYKPLPQLVLGETELGYKMLLKNVPIRRGVAFLEPKCVELKEYRNEDLESQHEANFIRSLRVRMGLPIPQGDDEATQQAHPAPPIILRRSPLRQIDREPSPTHPDFFDEPTRRRVPSVSPFGSTTSTLVGSVPASASAAAGPSTTSASNSGPRGSNAQSTTSPYFNRTSGSSTHGQNNAFLDLSVSPTGSRPIRGIPGDKSKGKSKASHATNAMEVDTGYNFGNASNDTDIEDEDEFEASLTGTGNQRKPSNGNSNSTNNNSKGKSKARDNDTWLALADERSSEYGDDLDLGSAFFADLERVEREALNASQQSQSSQPQPQPQGGGGGRPAPTTTVNTSRTTAGGARGPTGGTNAFTRPLARGDSPSIEIIDSNVREVITIDDDDAGDTDLEGMDKENVPVPTRNVRRRVDNSQGTTSNGHTNTGRGHHRNSSGSGPRSSQSTRTGRPIILADNSADIIDISD